MKPQYFILLALSFLWSLTAQAQDEAYYVGDLSVTQIETDFIEVAFCGIPFKPGENMTISYGQECLATVTLRTGRAFLLQCNGVQDVRGNLVVFNDYIQGLNYIKSQGWELVEIMDNISEGSSSPRNSRFLFKRAYDSRATVKINQGK